MKKICDYEGAKYIRFADDQIFYSKSPDTSKRILYESSKQLFKLNLNINSSKVKVFKSRLEFENYWSFDLFEMLSEPNNQKNIQNEVEMYFHKIDKNESFRDFSVLKRLLSIDFKLILPEQRFRLISGFYNPEFLSQLTIWYFKKIRVIINNDQELFQILDSQINSLMFNTFHYQLLKFYKKYRTDFDFNILFERINQLKT